MHIHNEYLSRWSRVVAVAAVLASTGAISEAAAQGGPDIYLVYARESRDLRREVVSQLGSRLNVSTYNADLLGVADYSGRQKVIARLDRARVVIVLGADALELLGEGGVTGPLVLTTGAGGDLASGARTVRVVGGDGGASNAVSIGAVSDVATALAGDGPRLLAVTASLSTAAVVAEVALRLVRS